MSFNVLDVDDCAYEPIDLYWSPGEFQKIASLPYRTKWSLARKEILTDDHRKAEKHSEIVEESGKGPVAAATDARGDISDLLDVLKQTTRIQPIREEEVFRRMSVVWEPIFNKRFRAMICRCILSQETTSPRAPELNFEIPYACPRHSVRPPGRAQIEIDYSKDSYFDKYGGYDTFRVWAACSENSWPYLNQEEFLPKGELMKRLPLLEDASGDVIDQLLEYDEEVKTAMECVRAAMEGMTLPLPGQPAQWYNKLLMEMYQSA